MKTGDLQIKCRARFFVLFFSSMSAACGSSGVMLESARVVGFHVHFRPDVKETPRSALFPKAFAVSDVPFFLYADLEIVS